MRLIFLNIVLFLSLVLSLTSCHEESATNDTSIKKSIKIANDKYNSDTLIESLEQIRLWLEKNNPDIAKSLRPGLSKKEIDHKTRKLPFKLPQEVYDLYMWRDGTENIEGYDYHPFIWYHHFMSLDEAISEYTKLSRFPMRFLYGWKNTWFPLFSYPEEYYYIDCSTQGNKALPIWHYLLEDPDDIISFTNLTTFMQTAALWYESEAVYVEDQNPGYLESMDAELEKIHNNFNPNTIFPFAVDK